MEVNSTTDNDTEIVDNPDSTDQDDNSIPLPYNILSNSSLETLFPHGELNYNKDLALALLKADMEYQDIKSIINLHRQEAIRNILDSSLSGFNRMAHKDTANSCIPFKRKSYKIKCNSTKNNCQCPDGYVPCIHSKTMADYSLWKTSVTDICKGRNREDIVIVGKFFNRYNCDGELIGNEMGVGSENTDLDNENSCEICEFADAILCRRKHSICETTQWFEWSGCSKPCGPGIQKRYRIFLNDKCDGEYREETRNCQLAECPPRIPNSRCKFMKLPEKKANQFMYDSNLYGCICPIKGYIPCSAEEALNNEHSWMDDFINDKDEFLNSARFKRLLSQGLEQEYIDHLSSSYRVLMRGGVIVDGSKSWSIASDYDLYWLCRPGAPVLCRENIEYEMVQGSSYAQLAFKPDLDPNLLITRLGPGHYSIIIFLFSIILLFGYIITNKFGVKKIVNKVKNKFKQS